MTQPRTFMLLGAVVLSLGIAAGTLLWLKLTPRAPSGPWKTTSLEGLERFGSAPDFSLTERSGRQVTLADLRDRVWIVDFIYTTCTDTCPMQTAAMAQLQSRFEKEAEIRFVSITVDPEHDTTAVLSTYADKFNASRDRWLFLTGDQDQIGRIVQQGFRLSAVPVNQDQSEERVIIHSPRFVVVDRQSEIRGYYDSRDGAALERLYKDVGTLLDRKEKS